MLKNKMFSLEEAIAKKEVDAASILLTQDAESAAIASFFLRNVKARTDVGQAIVESIENNTDLFIKKLEQVRNSLSKGNISLAGKIVEQMNAKENDERSELLLEKARVALLSGNTQTSLEIAEQALLLNPHPLTRMTLLQIQGHACINLNNHIRALEILTLGKEISVLFPYASSASCVRRFLVKAYILNNQINEAQREMTEFYELLNSWEKDAQWLERLQIALRAESDLQTALKNNSAAILALHECIEISKWLDDNITENRCLEDLKNFPVVEAQTPQERIVIKDRWSFLKRHQVLLNKAQKSLSILSDSPVSKKLIEVASDGAKTHEEIFTIVWKMPYNKERHAQHLRMALSKLRKILPAECVLNNNGLIEVK